MVWMDSDGDFMRAQNIINCMLSEARTSVQSGRWAAVHAIDR